MGFSDCVYDGGEGERGVREDPKRWLGQINR